MCVIITCYQQSIPSAPNDTMEWITRGLPNLHAPIPICGKEILILDGVLCLSSLCQKLIGMELVISEIGGNQYLGFFMSCLVLENKLSLNMRLNMNIVDCRFNSNLYLFF